MQPGRQRLLLPKLTQNHNNNNNDNNNNNNKNNDYNYNNNNYNYNKQQIHQNLNQLDSSSLIQQSQPAEQTRTESTLDDALKEIPVDQFSDLWQIITRISDTTASSSGHLPDTVDGAKRRQLPPNPTLAQVLGIANE